MRTRHLTLAALLLAFTFNANADSPYAPWKNGPPKDDTYFPIAVWLQSPSRAAQYKAIGINTYVGSWRGPSPRDLETLQKEGISLYCSFKPELKNEKTIIGWMHGDEPDNAQSLPGGKGYGPPITPDKIVADYQKIKAAAPTRPVMLNLGQGVAYDNYIGRGVRRHKLEDYPKYIQGSDIVSFDIYPVVHETPEIAGHLEYVPKGVTRLREWSSDQKIVWNCIETTHISNVNAKATPQQVKTEVWMSLIHGSRGIIYFAHEFKPKFVEAGLLADKEMATAVGQINAQIKSLAPALNAPEEKSAVTLTNSNDPSPIAFTARRANGALYLFAVAMRNTPTHATFTLKTPAKVEVLDESRTLDAPSGKLEDDFKGYEVHLYKITPQ